MAERCRAGARYAMAILAASVAAQIAATPAVASSVVTLADPCSSQGAEAVQVAGVEERLELRLSDGRVLRLAGVDPVLATPDQPDGDERARLALAALLAHGTIAIRAVTTQPDRWGRLTGFAFARDTGGSPRDLGVAALSMGLGRYLAEPAATACRSVLLAAEAKAREARLGLWSDPYYAVLAVDDHAGFAERAGSSVIVEGRLASVDSGPYRTKLVFEGRVAGAHGGRALSATAGPRVMKSFEGRGVSFSSLVGRVLRLRGLLDLRFGPQIDLAGPDDVEVLAAVPFIARSAAPATSDDVMR